MTASPRPLATFRPNGVNEDDAPVNLPDDIWSGAVNCVPADGSFMERVGGVDERLDVAAGTVTPHFHSAAYDAENSTAYWFYFTESDLYRRDGGGTATAMTYPSYTSFTRNAKDISSFTAGLVNGWPWFNKDDDAPAYWDFTGNAKAHTNWPANQTAGAMWQYKFHLFAGDINDGSGNYQPALVQWTDAIPGRTAPDWGTGASSQAGSNELSEIRGRIQNGGAIRGSCAIYGQNTTYLVDFIGGSFVFAFREFSNQMGLLSRHGFVGGRGPALLPDRLRHSGTRWYAD